MGTMGFIPLKNPADSVIEGFKSGADAGSTIVDAFQRSRAAAIQNALVQQQLVHQAAIAPLQAQALQLQNTGQSIKNQYAPDEAKADISLKSDHAGYFGALGNYKAITAPSVADKNEAAASQSSTKSNLNQQQYSQNVQMNPIKLADAQTTSDALSGKIADNHALVNAKLDQLGIDNHTKALLAPGMVSQADAKTAQMNAAAAKTEASTDVLRKALETTGGKNANPNDLLNPVNVVQHWDPNDTAGFIQYTRGYYAQKLDPTGTRSVSDQNFNQTLDTTGQQVGSSLMAQRQQQALDAQHRSVVANGIGAMLQQHVANLQQAQQAQTQPPAAQQTPAVGAPGGPGMPSAPPDAPASPAPVTPQPAAPQVAQAPQAPQTPAGPKRLDPQTAAQILQQAGGDKAKARAMATQMGYVY